MPVIVIPHVPLSDPPKPSEIFANLIIRLLQGMHDRDTRPGQAQPFSGPVLVVLYERLRRLSRRFVALAERIANGTWRPLTVRRSRAGETRTAAGVGGKAAVVVPRLRLGWFLGITQMHGGLVAQLLRAWLSDAEIARLVAVDPKRFGRILRPLCHAVGLAPSAALIALPKLPPRVRKSRALPVSAWPRRGYERQAPGFPPKRADAGLSHTLGDAGLAPTHGDAGSSRIERGGSAEGGVSPQGVGGVRLRTA